MGGINKGFYSMNNKIKFVEALPDSFQDPELFPSGQSHLVILDNAIFQASEHFLS